MRYAAWVLWSVLVLPLASCTGGAGPCVGGACVCENEPDCEFLCAAVPCEVSCRSLSTCAGSCGDACLTTCTDTSTCDLACGDGCGVECARVSTCRVDCGADCAVDCSDLAHCDVVMESGEVVCARVGNCDIACLRPDGSTFPAEHCGGGRFACPGC